METSLLCENNVETSLYIDRETKIWKQYLFPHSRKHYKFECGNIAKPSPDLNMETPLYRDENVETLIVSTFMRALLF